MPMQRYPSLYDEMKGLPDFSAEEPSGEMMLERDMPEAECEALAKSIFDNAFPGNIYLGRDPEHTREAIRKYGWKGVNAIWHPEDYPTD